MDAGETRILQANPIIVEIYKVFNGNLQYKPGTIITLKCGKLRNPRLLEQTTTDLIVQNLTANTPANPTWSFKVQMKKLPSFLDFRVEMLSHVTGADTEYNFKFVAGNEIVN